MQNTQILYPLCAMALLVFVVVVFMLRERVGEFKSRRIHPQKLPSSSRAYDEKLICNTMHGYCIARSAYVVRSPA